MTLWDKYYITRHNIILVNNAPGRKITWMDKNQKKGKFKKLTALKGGDGADSQAAGEDKEKDFNPGESQQVLIPKINDSNQPK